MVATAVSRRAGSVGRRVAPEREEAFLDTTNIESTSGLTYGVNRPTKSGSNPIVLSASSGNQNYHTLNAVGGTLLDDGTTIALTTLGAKTGFSAIVPTYVTSTDGVTFTQPSLSLVNWGGSTSNNVMHPTGLGDVSDGGSSPEERYSISAHFYDDDSAQWVALMRGWNTTPGGQLYTSPNPYGPWTYSNLLCAINDGPSFPQWDPNAIVQRSDGRWLSYGQKMTNYFSTSGTATGTVAGKTNGDSYYGRRRDVLLLLSDTTNPFGSWTNMGTVLDCSVASRQYYGATAWRTGDTICVAVWIFDGSDYVPPINTFDGTLNRVHKISLYTGGEDGLTLTLADDDWLSSTGSTGDWDGGQVLTGGVPLVVGDETRFYYAADNSTHHQDYVAAGKKRLLGLSTWGKNRLGKLSGTGSVILDPVFGNTSGTITVNSASGTVTVELLNPWTGVVLDGYSSAQCDTIASGYATTVSWGGRTRTPSRFKVKVYGTSAEINYVTVA